MNLIWDINPATQHPRAVFPFLTLSYGRPVGIRNLRVFWMGDVGVVSPVRQLHRDQRLQVLKYRCERILWRRRFVLLALYKPNGEHEDDATRSKLPHTGLSAPVFRIGHALSIFVVRNRLSMHYDVICAFPTKFFRRIQIAELLPTVRLLPYKGLSVPLYCTMLC